MTSRFVPNDNFDTVLHPMIKPFQRYYNGHQIPSMAMDPDFYHIVHLDLKGAPPKLNYLAEVFPLLHKWGSNCLLIEYEDMFPYEGELETIAAEYAYSRENIQRIQQLAEQNKLEIIPLIQTFGHFEFVLKHEKFKKLREVAPYPAALCPSDPDSMKTVQMMIDQVIALHPQARRFHIGADEVYYIGVCEHCQKRMHSEKLSSQQMFFAHIRAVISYIKTHYSHITVLMWDDMMRITELSILEESGIGNMVEPMVWHYLNHFLLPPDIWDRYSKVFPNIWLASAFKGATGSCMYVTNIMYHVENHLAWIAMIAKEKQKFQRIRGIAITGWQRYDHYAILCEVLPEALPCLAICLNVLKTGMFNSDVHLSVSQELQFESALPLIPDKSVSPNCKFPGSEIYLGMLELLRLELEYEEYMHSDRRLTWMNDYSIARKFVNPAHLQSLLNEAIRLLNSLQQLQFKMQQCLVVIFYDNMVSEWIGVHIEQKLEKLKAILDKASPLLPHPTTAAS